MGPPDYIGYFIGFEKRYRFCWLSQIPLFNFIVIVSLDEIIAVNIEDKYVQIW